MLDTLDLTSPTQETPPVERWLAARVFDRSEEEVVRGRRNLRLLFSDAEVGRMVLPGDLGPGALDAIRAAVARHRFDLRPRQAAR